MSETSGPTTETPQTETDAVNPETNSVIEEEAVPASDEVIGRAFLWSLAVLALAGVVAVAAYVFTPGKAKQPSQGPIRWALPDETEHAEAEIPYVPFTNVTEEAGIHFRHINGAAGDKLMPEIMGSGCAFFDFDNDGDQDLLLINFNYWADKKPEGAFAEPTMHLYQNDGTGHFEDVTTPLGTGKPRLAMGSNFDDLDGDGWLDVYVGTGEPTLRTLIPNVFLKNVKGRFLDATTDAGLGHLQKGHGIAFADFDNDGDLDLYETLGGAFFGDRYTNANVRRTPSSARPLR